MSLLTSTQKEHALDMIQEQQSALMFDYLISSQSSKSYSTEQLKIFTRGFMKGFKCSTEIMEVFLGKVSEKKGVIK